MLAGVALMLGFAGIMVAKGMDSAERAKAAAYKPAKISYRQCVIHEVICQSGANYDGSKRLWQIGKEENMTIAEAEDFATEMQCLKEGIGYCAPKFNDIFRSYRDICGKTIGKNEAAQIIRERGR